MRPIYQVKRYTSDMAVQWDDFVSRARNGLFIFLRSYMDYHADRFSDHSLLVFEEEKLRGILPANREEDVLVSHGGLTFGGLVVDGAVRAQQTLDMLESIVGTLPAFGIKQFNYKQIPDIFQKPRSSDDSYALYRVGAKLTRVDANFVLDLRDPPPVQERRARSIKKAVKAGVSTSITSDFAPFWRDVLIPTLQERHSVKPVHTIEEIELLYARHPAKIALRVATREGRAVAGSVTYDYGTAIHTQYIAANNEARECGALDLVMNDILTTAPTRYLSFGISTEDQGRVLNNGLAEWKESFGGRCVAHNQYILTVRT